MMMPALSWRLKTIEPQGYLVRNIITTSCRKTRQDKTYQHDVDSISKSKMSVLSRMLCVNVLRPHSIPAHAANKIDTRRVLKRAYYTAKVIMIVFPSMINAAESNIINGDGSADQRTTGDIGNGIGFLFFQYIHLISLSSHGVNGQSEKERLRYANLFMTVNVLTPPVQKRSFHI